MADVALEVDPESGYLAYDEVVIIGPRQLTGKTEFMLPYATHRCVGFDAALTDWIAAELEIVLPPPGPQTVLYTAQTADAARDKWRYVHLQRLQASPLHRDRRPQLIGWALQRNQERMDWRNGSVWSPGSTTGKTAGTGDTLDLPVIDEAWSRPDNRTELGMRPAKLTRHWSQLLVMSMVPGPSRAGPGDWPYLKAKRDLGRARVAAGARRGTAFFDFTAPAGLDPGDPATWYTCMPGLGRTGREDTVRSDFEAMSGAGQLADFCAEYLGWEPDGKTASWRLIPRDLWSALADPDSTIVGRPALAAEMSEDRSRGWIGAAGFREDGDFGVEVIEPGHRIPANTIGVDWMERRLADIVADQRAWTTVIDPGRPAASLIVPLRNRKLDVTTPSGPEIAGACGRFFDATGARRPDGAEPGDVRRLFHRDQRDLNRAVAQAQRFDTPRGGFVFVRRGESAELGPLYLVTLALHGLLLKGAHGDYDLLDSVDDSRRCGCGRYVYRVGQGWRHADDDSSGCPD